MEDSIKVDTVEALAATATPLDLGLADSVKGDTAEADTVTVTDADTGAFTGGAGGATVLVLEMLKHGQVKQLKEIKANNKRRFGKYKENCQSNISLPS